MFFTTKLILKVSSSPGPTVASSSSYYLFGMRNENEEKYPYKYQGIRLGGICCKDTKRGDESGRLPFQGMYFIALDASENH